MIEKACPETNLTKNSTRVAISGSGNVAQYAALKVIDLGATVVSLSDSRGSLIATTDEGFTRDVVQAIMQLKLDGGYLESFEKFADAAKSFERAIGIGGTDPGDVAYLRMLAAKATWESGDRANGMTMALRARAELAGFGDAKADQVKDADVWIASHTDMTKMKKGKRR